MNYTTRETQTYRSENLFQIVRFKEDDSHSIHDINMADNGASLTLHETKLGGDLIINMEFWNLKTKPKRDIRLTYSQLLQLKEFIDCSVIRNRPANSYFNFVCFDPILDNNLKPFLTIIEMEYIGIDALENTSLKYMYTADDITKCYAQLAESPNSENQVACKVYKVPYWAKGKLEYLVSDNLNYNIYGESTVTTVSGLTGITYRRNAHEYKVIPFQKMDQIEHDWLLDQYQSAGIPIDDKGLDFLDLLSGY